MFKRVVRGIHSRISGAYTAKSCEIRLNKPLASITFDDFFKSAWAVGGKIMSRAGCRATYYVSGSLCGQTVDGQRYYDEEDLRQLHGEGHEAACHSFDHLHMLKASSRKIEESVALNAAFLEKAIGQTKAASFAYPYGELDIRSKRLMARLFPASRGITPGVNRGWMDLAQLRCVCLEPHVLASHPVEGLIARTIAANGWLIFVTHDVGAAPSPYGCKPEFLEELVRRLQQSGIEIVTVRDALERVRQATQSR